MASLNRTDRLTLDAFSDPNLAGPVYNKFTNTLKNPLLGVKGVQMVNLDTINASLQLNDDNGQLLFFFYYATTAASICTYANMGVIRLLPSWYQPAAGFNTYVKNAYFNSGTELAAALTNAGSSTGGVGGANGDSFVNNPLWARDFLSFSYDTASRRMIVNNISGGYYIALAAADDPNVLDVLRGTTNAGNRITMNCFGGTNPFQPYREGITMNARLGFPLKYGQRGPFWNGSSQLGVATNTNTPINGLTITSDTPPILLGVQNIGVYLSIVTGGGTDSKGRKNLIGTVPMESAPYAVQSYTMCSVEVPSLSTANEIYEITVELICPETGVPFNVWSNANTSVGLTLTY